MHRNGKTPGMKRLVGLFSDVSIVNRFNTEHVGVAKHSVGVV